MLEVIHFHGSHANPTVEENQTLASTSVYIKEIYTKKMFLFVVKKNCFLFILKKAVELVEWNPDG